MTMMAVMRMTIAINMASDGNDENDDSDNKISNHDNKNTRRDRPEHIADTVEASLGKEP